VLEITGLDTWVSDWDPAWSKGSRVGCTAQDALSASRDGPPGLRGLGDASAVLRTRLGPACPG
jgi:hypothetical protein